MSIPSIITFPDTTVETMPTTGLLSVVGNTPLLPLRRITAHLSPGVQVLAKAEWFNPGGSVKDRPALNILWTALRRGDLLPGKRLLDSTSGNMGIAYTTLGKTLDVPVTLVMPSNASSERKMILSALGAELVLTDPAEGSDGAILVARQMAAERPDLYFYANQYDNPANWEAHYLTTGPEIIRQTDGNITHFIAGLGTSGTLTGVARRLHEQTPGVQIAAVQPDGPLHGLEGLKHMETAIQPEIYDPSLPDRVLQVTTEDAYRMVQRLAREEGLFVGISSGAAAAAAVRLGEELEEGTIVTVFPDAGYKYLSEKALWEEGAK